LPLSSGSRKPFPSTTSRKSKKAPRARTAFRQSIPGPLPAAEPSIMRASAPRRFPPVDREVQGRHTGKGSGHRRTGHRRHARRPGAHGDDRRHMGVHLRGIQSAGSGPAGNGDPCPCRRPDPGKQRFKMEMLYDFLTGGEFRQQVEAIVEGFSQMQADLEGEKRAMQVQWKKRENSWKKSSSARHRCTVRLRASPAAPSRMSGCWKPPPSTMRKHSYSQGCAMGRMIAA
jgi:hypothetical protein